MVNIESRVTRVTRISLKLLGVARGLDQLEFFFATDAAIGSHDYRSIAIASDSRVTFSTLSYVRIVHAVIARIAFRADPAISHVTRILDIKFLTSPNT